MRIRRVGEKFKRDERAHWERELGIRQGQVFKAFGLDLEIVKAGCCGMAGAFGHETTHYDESKGIYEQSWKLKLADSDRPIVATGASCRSQVQRFDGGEIAHPLQLLSRLLG